MKTYRMDHVGVVVNDLPAAKAFFEDLGFELLGEAALEGSFLDNVIRLNGAKTEFIVMRPPDGQTGVELIKFLSPLDETDKQPNEANTLGIRHIAFEVDDIDAIVAKLKGKGMELFSEVMNYENIYKLVYVRGPEGIIVELAERIG